MTLYLRAIFIVLSLFFFFESKSFGQTDDIELSCTSCFKLPFISDGQSYKVPFDDNNTAKFEAVFYRGITYRIQLCGECTHDVTFELKDILGNLLFCSEDFNNPAYWDFRFSDTQQCFIFIYKTEEREDIQYGVFALGYKQIP